MRRCRRGVAGVRAHRRCGAEHARIIARAVIDGLTVSTLFTLFLVPALYTLLGRFAASAEDVEEEDAAHA